MPAVSRSASHFRPRPDKRPWDTLVVAEQRATRKALAALAGYGEFRDSGYPCVLVGARAESGGVSLVEPAVLEAIAPLVQRIFLAEGSREFERDDVTETLCEVLEGEAPRLAGRSFYVRANLRGMKGRLEHPAVERALGAFLWERTEGRQRGHRVVQGSGRDRRGRGRRLTRGLGARRSRASRLCAVPRPLGTPF